MKIRIKQFLINIIKPVTKYKLEGASGFFILLAFTLLLVLLYWRWFFFGKQVGPVGTDWGLFYGYLAFIKYAISNFRLPLFDFFGHGFIFGNAETSAFWPANILFLFVGILNFLKINLLLHYCIAFAGLWLIFSHFKLNKVLIPLAFVVGFLNGNISAHFFAGHDGWLAYFLLPLLYGCYLYREKHMFYPLCMGAIVSLAFYEGGQHLTLWFLIFIFINAVVNAIFSRNWWLELKSLLLFVSSFFLLSLVKYLPSANLYEGFYSEKSVILPGFANLRQLYEFLIVGSMRTLSGPDYAWALMWWESFSYIGLIPVLLLILYLIFPFAKRSKEEWGLLITGFVFLLFSYNRIWRFIAYGAHSLTLISQRHPTRFILMAIFCLGILICIWLSRYAIKFGEKYHRSLNFPYLLLTLIVFATFYLANAATRNFLHGIPELNLKTVNFSVIDSKSVFQVKDAPEANVRQIGKPINTLKLQVKSAKDFKLSLPFLVDTPPQDYQLFAYKNNDRKNKISSLKDETTKTPYFDLAAGEYDLTIRNSQEINWWLFSVSLFSWLSLAAIGLSMLIKKQKQKHNANPA